MAKLGLFLRFLFLSPVSIASWGMVGFLVMIFITNNPLIIFGVATGMSFLALIVDLMIEEL